MDIALVGVGATDVAAGGISEAAVAAPVALPDESKNGWTAQPPQQSSSMPTQLRPSARPIGFMSARQIFPD
jgi:hypothetical protein